ncbi:MAG: acyl-CoA dehydrogenase family protein, partial [Pseudomonadota bacterium]
MSLLLNPRDVEFNLYEFLDTEALFKNARYADHDRETVNAVIEASLRLAEEKFASHAAEIDAQEPSFDGEKVKMLPAVKDALDAYSEAGFMGIAAEQDLGGSQFPFVVTQATQAYFTAANVGTAGYTLLTHAAINLLTRFGSEEQRATYGQPLVEGRYFGTMCLSEPQAGSSLSDIQTKAEPTGEEHYLITGTKMWISGGEHELSDNIVHLVLAKVPGGPPGVKGISMFLVPKYEVNDDGSLGSHNNIALAGLNHKMGYRGTTNTILNFGEQGPCKGYLIGDLNQGLFYMFHMMNEARVAVGMGAAVLGYTGYLHSLQYAKDRPQGRHPQQKDPTSPQIPIIEHTDIRRLLLAQKSAAEGSLSLVFLCAYLIDLQKTASDPAAAQRHELLLEILTPIAKSWPSEFCLEANKHAIQILGGYGYTREFPVERFYRDNRLNPIHEGTHGIQALDLLGRKVSMGGGAALARLVEDVESTRAEAEAVAALATYSQSLRVSLQTLLVTTERLNALKAEGEINLALANAGL